MSVWTSNGITFTTSVDPNWLTRPTYYISSDNINYTWNINNSGWDILINPYKIKKELNKNIEVL